MNLRQLNDNALLSKTISLVQEERDRLITLLHHLREIEARRLFSSLGYKSLFDFAVRKLGYSEDQAYRRISAMRLLKEVPEIEEKISEGHISLTHIGIAQSFFKQEAKVTQKEITKEAKIEVFNRIACKTIREAERMTLALSSAPSPLREDKMKTVSSDQIEFKFYGPKELQDKIEKLRGLLAHKSPSLTLSELFDQLCDLGLKEYSPAAPRKRRITILKSKAQIRRETFQKANNQCEKCGSDYALEVDHIIPQALGGSSDPSNLRILCRSCNQRAAIVTLGRQKMQNYLEDLT